MGFGENDRKQAMLLQDPGAQLCFLLFCHRPEQLFTSLLIVIPATLPVRAAEAVSLKTCLLQYGCFGTVCYGAGHLLRFHSNAVLKHFFILTLTKALLLLLVNGNFKVHQNSLHPEL